MLQTEVVVLSIVLGQIHKEALQQFHQVMLGTYILQVIKSSSAISSASSVSTS